MGSAPRYRLAQAAAHPRRRWRGAPRCARLRSVFNPAPIAMQASAIRHDSRAWKAQVWISFATAVVLCAVGLAYLPGQDIDRAFMVMGYLFCLTTAFALAKFVRDNEVRRTDTPLWGIVIWGGFWMAMALTPGASGAWTSTRPTRPSSACRGCS